MKKPLFGTLFFIFLALAWNASDLFDYFGYGYRNVLPSFYGYLANQSIQHRFLLPVWAMEGDSPYYYLHHLPLVHWITCVNYLIFGASEWSVRLIGLVFYGGWMGLICLISGKLWSVRHALSASIVLAFVPLSVLYGSLIPDMVSLFFVLLNLWCYFRFHQTKERRYWIGLLSTLLLGSLCYWHVYYLIPIYFVHNLMKDRDRKILLWYPSFSMLILGIWFVVLARTSSFHQDLSYVKTILLVIPPTTTWISAMARHFHHLVTIPILILSFFGCIVNKHHRSFVVMLGLYGLTHVFLFRIYFITHDYFLIHLLPFLVVSTGLGIFHLAEAVQRKTVIKGSLLLAAAVFTVFLVKANVTQYQNIKTDLFYRSGQSIREKTSEGALIYIRGMHPMRLYYSGRTIDAELLLEDRKKLWEEAIERHGVKFF